jgi:hypothetical protein
MKIKRIKDNLIVTIPLVGRRNNPYNEMAGEDPDTGEMDNVVGVIEKQSNGWIDMGFMYLQDMSYKGKDDQLTDWAVKWHGTEEEFKKICKKIDVSIWEIFNK